MNSVKNTVETKGEKGMETLHQRLEKEGARLGGSEEQAARRGRLKGLLGLGVSPARTCKEVR